MIFKNFFKIIFKIFLYISARVGANVKTNGLFCAKKAFQLINFEARNSEHRALARA